MNYTAKSLEDIAEMFEGMAANVLNSPLQNTKISKAKVEAMNYVWKEAARILRETKLEVEHG